jgi:peroxiredoxin
MKYFLSMLLVFVFTLPVVKGQEVNYKRFGVDTTQHVPLGLKVGDKAPTFKGIDQYGNQIQLRKLLKKGPVVLFFYRGYWCHYCNLALAKFQDSLKYITDRGATVVAVSAQTPENSEKIIKKHDVTFHVISDTTGKIMKSYDVLFHVTKAYQLMLWKAIKTDIKKVNDQASAHLPVPATFVINRKGKVVWRQFNYNYSKRAMIKDVLTHLPH